MNIEQRQIIQWQCQQLALRVSYFIDQQNYTAMAELFTKDAIFARPTDPDNPIISNESGLTLSNLTKFLLSSKSKHITGQTLSLSKELLR